MTKEKEQEVGKIGPASNLLERLQQASNEIDSIKNSFSKNMNELDRVQNMLSFDDLNKITGMIQDFETRIMLAERQREEAAEGARRYSQELEKEKERLMKLWDAYKTQEDELSTHEKKTMQLEEQVKELELTKNQLDRDLTARISTLTKKLEETEKHTQQVSEYQHRMQEYETMRDQMDREIMALRTDARNKDETIVNLQRELSNLKQYENYAEYKTKYEDLCRDYDKEKERLTKLFRLYEETESECNVLKKEVTDWQNWFNENEEIFNKLFTSAAHLRRSTQTTPTTTTSLDTPEYSIEDPAIEDEALRPKKKLRFRK